MKLQLVIGMIVLLLASPASGQGKFAFNNIAARTHIGSLDGPLADSDIWAEPLVGLTPETLMPLGIAVQHYAGLVPRVTFTVPGVQPCEFAYVQMVAWDGSLWGTSLAQVPPDQLGRTDTLHIFLGGAEAPHPDEIGRASCRERV